MTESYGDLIGYGAQSVTTSMGENNNVQLTGEGKYIVVTTSNPGDTITGFIPPVEANGVEARIINNASSSNDLAMPSTTGSSVGYQLIFPGAITQAVLTPGQGVDILYVAGVGWFVQSDGALS